MKSYCIGNFLNWAIILQSYYSCWTDISNITNSTVNLWPVDTESERKLGLLMLETSLLSIAKDSFVIWKHCHRSKSRRIVNKYQKIGVRIKWSLRSPLTQAILWFYDFVHQLFIYNCLNIFPLEGNIKGKGMVGDISNV